MSVDELPLDRARLGSRRWESVLYLLCLPVSLVIAGFAAVVATDPGAGWVLRLFLAALCGWLLVYGAACTVRGMVGLCAADPRLRVDPGSGDLLMSWPALVRGEVRVPREHLGRCGIVDVTREDALDQYEGSLGMGIAGLPPNVAIRFTEPVEVTGNRFVACCWRLVTFKKEMRRRDWPPPAGTAFATGVVAYLDDPGIRATATRTPHSAIPEAARTTR